MAYKYAWDDTPTVKMQGGDLFSKGSDMLTSAIENLQKPLNTYQQQEMFNAESQSKANTGAGKSAIREGKDPSKKGFYNAEAYSDTKYEYDKYQQDLKFKRAAEARANAAAGRAAAAHKRAMGAQSRTDANNRAYAEHLIKSMGGSKTEPQVEKSGLPSIAEGQAALLDTLPKPMGATDFLNIENRATPVTENVPAQFKEEMISNATHEMPVQFPFSPAEAEAISGSESPVDTFKRLATPSVPARQDVVGFEPTPMSMPTPMEIAKEKQDVVNTTATEQFMEAAKLPPAPAKAGTKEAALEIFAKKKAKVESDNAADLARTKEFIMARPGMSKTAYKDYQARVKKRNELFNTKLNEIQKTKLKSKAEIEKAKALNKLGFGPTGKPFETTKSKKTGKVGKGEFLSTANKLMKESNFLFDNEGNGNIDNDNALSIRDALVEQMANGVPIEALSTALSKASGSGGWFSYVSGRDEMQFDKRKFNNAIRAYSLSKGLSK